MLEKGSPSPTVVQRGTNVLRLFAVVVFIFGCLFTAAPSRVHAQSTSTAQQSLQQVSQTSGLGNTDLVVLIGRIINIFLGVLGIILLVLLLYGGFLWMTSGGDEKKVAQAKATLRNAIIGLIIIAASFAIANFILSRLGEATQQGGVSVSGPAGAGFPSSAGALGGGIIEYHVPPRDATGVPRNTAIVITFKEPIKIASFIKGYDDNGTPSNLADDATSSTTTGLNDTAIRIYPTGQPNQALTSAQARVRFTADRKTFVIKPVNYLGSPTQNVGYTVELLSGRDGILREDGSQAFSGAFSSGYKWQFEVSTVVDLTPPRVTSVIPSSGGKYAPNVVVQINFSEPIDPTSASGIWNNNAGFTNIEVRAVPVASPNDPPTRPNGTFTVSNGYTTVEFVTDLACGVNSCGNKIYCLPSDSAISVLAKAATLSDTPPQADLTLSGYDGVTDIAGNSLDGNADGTAQGQGKDDYTWAFGTDNKPNLDAPRIKSTRPQAGDHQASSNIPLDQPPFADFDSVLQASTVNSDNVFIKTNESADLSDTFWWTPGQLLLNAQGQLATSSEPVTAGRISVNHRLYLPSTDPKVPPPEYYPYVLSGVQNVYQNCFNPAGSDVCRGPNCCDDQASVNACAYPVK